MDLEASPRTGYRGRRCRPRVGRRSHEAGGARPIESGVERARTTVPGVGRHAMGAGQWASSHRAAHLASHGRRLLGPIVERAAAFSHV